SGPNGGVNDTQQSQDSLTIANGVAASGDCKSFSSGTNTVSGSTGTQSTAVTYGPADSSLNLPCTPADAGVDPNPNHRPASFTEQLSFVELVELVGNATATVTIDFASLPTNLNTFVLYELFGSDPTKLTSWNAVPDCVSGAPPNPGIPPLGNDSCIFGRVHLPNGGAEFVLHVLGNPNDGTYGG